MLTVTILGPIVSSISCLYISRYLGTNVLKITVMLYVVSSLASVLLLYNTVVNEIDQSIEIINWSSLLGINLQFSVDLINASLLSVITVIGTCVISYSVYYMASDAHLYKFVGLLSSFVSFMAILAIGSNLVVLFIGWELIGLFSYLLIGYWSDRTEASTGALSAMLTNKLGDYLLSFGMILTFSQLSSLDISTINTVYEYYNTESTNKVIGILSISFIIAAMAKSAQIGLHLWLIHAMQGTGGSLVSPNNVKDRHISRAHWN